MILNKKDLFDPKPGASVITGVSSFEELLKLAVQQRGSLDGDDSEELLHMGVSEAFINAVPSRFVIIHVKGEVPFIEAGSLPPDQIVEAKKTKEDFFSSRMEGKVVFFPELLTTYHLPSTVTEIVILEIQEGATPEESEVHIGLPELNYTQYWNDGDHISAEDVVKKHSPQKYIRIIQ